MPYLGNGGAERVVVNVANGLRATGVQVGMATFEDDGEYERDLHPDIKRYSLRHRVKTIDEEARAVLFLLHVSKAYEIMISGLELRTDGPVYACKRLQELFGKRKRYLTLLHTVLSQYPVFTMSPRRAAFVKKAYPRFDSVIAISQGVKDDLLAILTAPANIEVINNPLPLEEIQRCAQQPLPMTMREPFFLAVGRLSAAKDFATLLRAYHLFRTAHPTGPQLLILGRGEQDAMLRQLAEKLEVQHSVHFLGFQANPWAFMRRAVAVVSSSIVEGWSQVLAEAMACGAPVIATNCPYGPTELLEHGRRGFLVPMRDPAALASMMHLVSTTPEAVQEKVALALDFTRQLDLPTVATHYLETIKRVKGKG